MKIQTLKIFMGMTFILMAIIPALAQPAAPPATPIDGGLSLLLAAGGIYGLKKLRDARRS